MLIEIKICVFNLPRSDMCVLTRSNWAVFLLLCCIQLIYFLSAYAFAYAIPPLGDIFALILANAWPRHDVILTKSGRHRPKLFMRTAPKFPLERTSQGVYLWVPPQYLWCACQCLSGHQQGTGRFRMDLVRGWSWGTMRNCLNGYPFAPMDILCLPHRSCRILFVHFDHQSS